MSDTEHPLATRARAWRESEAPIRAAAEQQRAARVLRYIHTHVGEHGYPPSRAEIADHLGGMSVSTAQLVIEGLKERGLISVRPASPRAIGITEAGMKAMTEEM